MAELSEGQLRRAIDSVLQEALPVPIEDDLTASSADLSPLCREAQNTLRAAIESAGSALWIGAVVNRMLKVSDRKAVRGMWATPAQDNLRAAVLFAGAGLDRALKRLAEDALPVLITFDQEVNNKLSTFAKGSITDKEGVSAEQLVEILLHEGTSPRDILARRWTYDLASHSAQSAGRVSEFASALGITDANLRKRVSQSSGKRLSPLEEAFAARNEIAHELDVTQPAAETRQKLERIRRRRSVGEMRGHVIEMLDVTQLIVNDVASRLAAEAAN